MLYERRKERKKERKKEWLYGVCVCAGRLDGWVSLNRGSEGVKWLGGLLVEPHSPGTPHPL